MERSSIRRLSALLPRRRTHLIALLAAFVLLAGYAALPALAVHDLSFQLDGDVSASTVTHNPDPPGTATQSLDWDSVFTAAGANVDPLPTGFTTAAFNRDFLTNANGSFNTSDATTYATGSKDTLPITPGWQCNRDANVNSKIDIMNAYSGAFTAPNNDEILYFALERNSNAGDGNVGFWFLQDNVGCVSPGGSTAFTGNHVDGDLLVVSAFTNGGSVSTIDVYRWNGGASGSLGTTPVAHGVDCKSTGGNDTACATVNGPTNGVGGTITTPWLTSNKVDGVGHSLRTSEFFEGGLNLTKAGLGGKCFNVFIGDTRSSQSLTATLFDFARGVLGECKVALTTTPSLTTTTLGSSDPITDLANLHGTTATGADGPKPTGTVSFFLCGPGVTGCATGGTAVTGNPVTLGNCTPDAAGHACATSGNVRSLVTAGGIGTYCFRAVYDPGADPNYQGKGTSFDGSSECFTVTDTSSIVTNQNWLPNDSATVTTAGGSQVSGTVTFSLYEDADCGVTVPTAVKATFTDNTPGDGFTTGNSTVYTASQTVSWKATFVSDNNVGGSTSTCEVSTVTINNNH
jgi:hypothetical protein